MNFKHKEISDMIKLYELHGIKLTEEFMQVFSLRDQSIDYPVESKQFSDAVRKIMLYYPDVLDRMADIEIGFLTTEV
jgi:hypothetical protein